MFIQEFEKTAVSAKKYKSALEGTVKRLGAYDASDKLNRHAIRSAARGEKLEGEKQLKNWIHDDMRRKVWNEVRKKEHQKMFGSKVD